MKNTNTHRELMIQEMKNLQLNIEENIRVNPEDKERLYFLQSRYPDAAREARKLVKEYFRKSISQRGIS